MLKEFREFAVKGNVVDMAVGIIIGAAFGKIVTSLVEDVVMPPIGFLLGKVDFSSLMLTVGGETSKVTIKYGQFLNQVINFLIVAFVVFILVKQVNRLRRKPAAVDPTTKECPFCCSAIAIKATRCPNCTSELQGA